MKFRDYIEQNHVFTVDQLTTGCDLSIPSVKATLRRAVEDGRIERARRGIYVSKVGRFAGLRADPFEIVFALDASAVLSFHSALEVHGVAHSVFSTCQFRSVAVATPFEYSAILYRPFPHADDVLTQVAGGRGGLRVTVTTREQTIVDCLEHSNRAGGIEEVLRSLSVFPYVDVEALSVLVSAKSPSLAARVGWLLEQKSERWRVSDGDLRRFESMARGGPFKLVGSQAGSLGWSKRWRLCLPEEEGEMREWML
jgi:predicted transcriptional regulator of viral defense system